MISILLRGFVIGISIAAPVGPIGLLCIRRTLADGRRMGFFSGLGAATADALYGSIAGFGLAFLSNLLVAQQTWFRLVGGIFLVYLGIKTFASRPANREVQTGGKGLFAAYLSTFFLTLTNPLTILAFAAIFAGLGLSSQAGSYMEAGSLVLGVFLGSVTWWLILSSIANLFRQRLNTAALTWINRASGLVILAFGMAALWGVISPGQKTSLPLNRSDLSSSGLVLAEGYARADGTEPLTFPRDFGAHPDYQTEWWYYTGNLWDKDGRRFGYQLTFFRRALLPPSQRLPRLSLWATDQAFLAHFALTDVQSGDHVAFERLARGAAGLAAAESQPFRVWLEDWEVKEISPATYRLVARSLSDPAASQPGQAIVLDLVLRDLKGPVLHGEQGYSQKGADRGNASYYFSQTRLVTQGLLQVDERSYQVEGTSWMDHEFSTSALAEGQVGWDWFSVQLADGSELMFFQIRRQDGSRDPFSSGTWIASNGVTLRLEQTDFEIRVTDNWKSPHSGIIYPSRWTVILPELDLSLELKPVLADQEMNLSYQYWEGAVDVSGFQAGKPVSGVGYVELTGYGESMAGEF